MTSQNSTEIDPMHDHLPADLSSLGWEQLEALLPDLPKTLCMRSIYLMDLIEDGLCSVEVKEAIEVHRAACNACRNGLAVTDGLRQVVQTYVDKADSYDAQASFDALLASRWDELDLGHLSAEAQQESSSSAIDSSREYANERAAHLRLEAPNTKISRRLRTSFFVAIAAALFFAYGRPLIEGKVDTPEFPTQPEELAGAQEEIGEANAPLKALLQKRHAYGFELQSITAINQATQQWRYQVKTSTPQQETSIFDLRSRVLDENQAKALRLQHSEAVRSGNGAELTGSERSVQVKVSSTPQLEVSEYALDNRLFQWSMRRTEGTTRSDLIRELIRAHLDEKVH